jgi:ABC-type Zn uptake system ZnuABC Zn-binding protein ZnuA
MIIITVTMKLRTILITALSTLNALSALALLACGSDSDDPGEPEVIATTGILADIARNVAGERVAVEQLIPNGSSPHDFQLSAQDRERLEQADLVLDNGAGLEAAIPLDELDGPRWTLTDEVGELLSFEEGGGDPHVWMDPARVAAALPSLARALGEADPDGRAQYARNARRYGAELRALDRRIGDRLAAVPPGDRELVTSHDSLGYLAERHGFEVIATAFPASGPESEASAARLQELADAIEASGIATVFAGEEDDPETLRTVADQAGVEVEDGLLIESPGSAATYERMLRHDADLIAGGLAR